MAKRLANDESDVTASSAATPAPEGRVRSACLLVWYRRSCVAPQHRRCVWADRAKGLTPQVSSFLRS